MRSEGSGAWPEASVAVWTNSACPGARKAGRSDFGARSALNRVCHAFAGDAGSQATRFGGKPFVSGQASSPVEGRKALPAGMVTLAGSAYVPTAVRTALVEALSQRTVPAGRVSVLTADCQLLIAEFHLWAAWNS